MSWEQCALVQVKLVGYLFPVSWPYAVQAFIQTMNSKKAAWLSFVEVMKNFLGNKKTNCEDFAG